MAKKNQSDKARSSNTPTLPALPLTKTASYTQVGVSQNSKTDAGALLASSITRAATPEPVVLAPQTDPDNMPEPVTSVEAFVASLACPEVTVAPASELRPTSPEELPAPPTPLIEPVPLSAWQICGESVIGLAHRRNGLPCQDAIAWRKTTRPILALSDGAGSAAISERGAAALVSGVTRFLLSMEDLLVPWLDDAQEEEHALIEIWARRLLLHARGLLNDLARVERRDVRDVRGTLLLAVVGTRRSFWWQVGDGAIVLRTDKGLRLLGTPNFAKGEFANQTAFVDTAKLTDAQFGVLPTAEIFGLALMSDGGAEKLVAQDGSRVAPRIGKWFDDLTRQSLSPDKIALAFHEPEMWERTNLDDRSLLMVARPA